jgi:hypothetical protein
MNIVMVGITNHLPEHDEQYELHRLLSVLLSENLNTKEKLNIIETEYDIPMSEKLRKEVGTMCNLADGIEERAEARGKASGELQSITNVVMNMHHGNFTLEQIVVATGKTIEEVKSIIERNASVLV